MSHTVTLDSNHSIKNVGTYVPRVNASKTCLFQENKARQVNTPQDKPDLNPTRFIEEGPPPAAKQAAVHMETVQGCTKLWCCSLLQCWFTVRRVAEHKLCLLFFRVLLSPLASAHSLPTARARAELTRSATSSHLGSILPFIRYQGIRAGASRMF